MHDVTPGQPVSTEIFSTGSSAVDTSSFDAADNLTPISDVKGPLTLFSATYTQDNANQLTDGSSAPTTNRKIQIHVPEPGVLRGCHLDNSLLHATAKGARVRV